jgi:serine protease Do
VNVKNPALIASVGAVAVFGAIAGLSAAGVGNSVAAPVALAAPSKATPIPFIGAPNYRAIVAANRAAVVGITTESKSGDVDENGNDNDDGSGQGQGDGPQSGGQSPFGDNPFFRYFGMPRNQEQVPVRALGSGFIVSPSGLILTNAHVVHGANRVTVTLSDHREFKAKVLGEDKATDVAVIKIDAKDLPTVHMTASTSLEVGDYVLAIGAPYGLEETATAGIVSAKGRSLNDQNDQSVQFIQTDVAVNPGNSGGPLFDAYGNVVGINSQIYSNTGGFEGVSFAIPIEVATHDEQSILKTGKVEHARLGVSIQGVNQSLAKSFHLEAPEGALVSKVEPDSAAARAGLRAGDVILDYNNAALLDAGQLSAAVAMAAPGDSVSMKVWRDGKTVDLTAKLGGVPAKAELVKAAATTGETLGLRVHPMTSDEANQTGISSGLVVDRVGGAAAAAGIEPGDVVLAVDGTAVTNVNQLRSMVGNHQNTVALLIQRGDARIFVPVQLG